MDMSGTGMFYMASMVKKLLIERPFSVDHDVEITFQDICLIDDFWIFVKTVFIDSIYGDSADSDETETLTILSENILMGPPRLKQLRVTNNSCAIDDLFKRNFVECFGTYKHSIEDFNPFGSRNGTA